MVPNAEIALIRGRNLFSFSKSVNMEAICHQIKDSSLRNKAKSKYGYK